MYMNVVCILGIVHVLHRLQKSNSSCWCVVETSLILLTGLYGRPSPPKIQGCQIDQQIQRWCKDQLQDSIANKGMAWPNYRQSSFPS